MDHIHRKQRIILFHNKSCHISLLAPLSRQLVPTGIRFLSYERAISRIMGLNHLRDVDLTCSLANEVDVDFRTSEGGEDFSCETLYVSHFLNRERNLAVSIKTYPRSQPCYAFCGLQPRQSTSLWPQRPSCISFDVSESESMLEMRIDLQCLVS